MPEQYTAQQALAKLLERKDLQPNEMQSLMRQIMSGEMSAVHIAAVLAALRTKGETVSEITAAARVMRELAVPVRVSDPSKLLDIVGTGGDGAHTFNISTCAMFVAAAAGAKISKHGNRGVSSKSGSADVLESLGVNLMLNPEQVARCIEEVGIGFMFAPNHHPAMKNVAPVRREMGVKTVFNVLGPLTNPANASHILMGVFHADLVPLLAGVLQELGVERAIVVHGTDGIDELSLGAPTLVAELRQGAITQYVIEPEQLGFKRSALDALRVSDVEQSKSMLLSVLEGQGGIALEVVLLNAGAALYAANIASSMEEGIALARQAISGFAAKRKLEALIEFTQSCI